MDGNLSINCIKSELYAVRHELRFIDNNEKVSVADFFITVLYAVLWLSSIENFIHEHVIIVKFYHYLYTCSCKYSKQARPLFRTIYPPGCAYPSTKDKNATLNHFPQCTERRESHASKGIIPMKTLAIKIKRENNINQTLESLWCGLKERSESLWVAPSAGQSSSA